MARLCARFSSSHLIVLSGSMSIDLYPTITSDSVTLQSKHPLFLERLRGNTMRGSGTQSLREEIFREGLSEDLQKPLRGSLLWLSLHYQCTSRRFSEVLQETLSPLRDSQSCCPSLCCALNLLQFISSTGPCLAEGHVGRSRCAIVQWGAPTRWRSIQSLGLSGIVSCDSAAIRVRIWIVRCQWPAKRQKHKPCETQGRFFRHFPCWQSGIGLESV